MHKTCASGRKWKQLKSASGKGYPHGFNNDEGLALTTPGPWLEFPVQASEPFKEGGNAGSVRVVFFEDPRFWHSYDVVITTLMVNPRTLHGGFETGSRRQSVEEGARSKSVDADWIGGPELVNQG
jgi:hypothetical protein